MEKREYTALFIVGFIFLYFVNGMITGFSGAKEIFPFFSWNLFGHIPNKVNEYAIIVEEYNGKKISPPQLFQEAKGIVKESDSVIAHNLIKDFGKAYDKKKIQEAERLQKLFNANFIKAPAQYRLIRIIYNPVERWKTGRYEAINIQQFMFGDH